jgi:hypothetical protein
MPIFSCIFLSNYWWQKSDIWSQASYRYLILWKAFFDPSDSHFLFAEERGYHEWALAHSSTRFISRLLHVVTAMTGVCLLIATFVHNQLGNFGNLWLLFLFFLFIIKCDIFIEICTFVSWIHKVPVPYPGLVNISKAHNI